MILQLDFTAKMTSMSRSDVIRYAINKLMAEMRRDGYDYQSLPMVANQVETQVETQVEKQVERRAETAPTIDEKAPAEPVVESKPEKQPEIWVAPPQPVIWTAILYKGKTELCRTIIVATDERPDTEAQTWAAKTAAKIDITGDGEFEISLER